MLGVLVLGFGGLVLVRAAFTNPPDPRVALAEIMSGQILTAEGGSGSPSTAVTGTARRSREDEDASVPSIQTRRAGPFLT